MRKLSLLAVVAAVFILGSCSNDRELDNSQTKNKEINFRSVIDKGGDTRATVTTVDNIRGFTVTAWWDKNSVPDSPIFGDTNWGGYLFNAFDITHREAGMQRWDYDPKLYWPNQGHGVYFFAYSPASSKNVLTGLYQYTGSELDYRVPDPGENESQEDFLLAQTGKLDKVEVELNFVHALSRARFFAVNEKPGVNYLIKRVELMNIHKEGRISYSNIVLDTDNKFIYAQPTPTVFWDPSSSANESISVDLGDSPVYVRTDDYYSILGPTNALMVLPQITEPGDAEAQTGFLVKVLYKAFIDVNDPGTYYAGTMGEDDSTYKAVYFEVEDRERPGEPHAFEIGRQYNFYLKFGSEVGDKIEFEVATGEWSDAPQVELPQTVYYWKDGQGIISEALAYAANKNYQTEGVMLGDIMKLAGRVTINFSGFQQSLEGLEHFQRITVLEIQNTSYLDVDLTGTNIIGLVLGSNANLSSLDISNITVNSLQVAAKGISSTDNKRTINRLKVWDGFEEGDSVDYRLDCASHSSGAPGALTVGAIEGVTSVTKDDVVTGKYFK